MFNSRAPVSTSSSPSSSQILPPSTSPRPPVALSTYTTAQAYPTKEFHKLLRPEIYHPLTHLTTPAPFRSSSTQPSPDTPLPTLLATGHFRAAAISAAQFLTTSTSPSDHEAIFSLLYIRLACLTLCGSTALAAQEATALEDLNSSAYRDEATGSHLVPWELRVLAVRLQGVGFNDPRKIIMGYYDLARQSRLEIANLSGKNTLYDESERTLWETRLSDLGLRVASALVEMEDLEGATHHLKKLSNSHSSSQMTYLDMQRAILWLRIGNVEAARGCISGDSEADGVVAALSDVAEGNYGDAVNAWQVLCERNPGNGMYRQNLAICLLYAGRMDRVWIPPETSTLTRTHS
jgi:trafficking protein particle complex subunit 12